VAAALLTSGKFFSNGWKNPNAQLNDDRLSPLTREHPCNTFETCFEKQIISHFIWNMMINIQAAWMGLLLGCLSGAIPGLFFYNSDWLGGYASWQRRMIRLAHISFFGLGFINLLFALTTRTLDLDSELQISSILLLTGAIAMPTICYLSAWKPVFRNLFFIPALSVTIGIALFVWRITLL